MDALKEIEEGLSSLDETTRWQAAIAAEELIYEGRPQDAWFVVKKYGSSENEDVRTAIATCVLEHLLEYHFEE
jgi:hypothetical protein